MTFLTHRDFIQDDSANFQEWNHRDLKFGVTWELTVISLTQYITFFFFMIYLSNGSVLIKQTQTCRSPYVAKHIVIVGDCFISMIFWDISKLFWQIGYTSKYFFLHNGKSYKEDQWLIHSWGEKKKASII